MTKFRWLNRQQYIKKTALLAYRLFCDAQKFCTEYSEDVKPAVNIDGIASKYIAEYSINSDWQSKKSMKLVDKQIKLECYELARMYQNKEAMEYFSEY